MPKRWEFRHKYSYAGQNNVWLENYLDTERICMSLFYPEGFPVRLFNRGEEHIPEEQLFKLLYIIESGADVRQSGFEERWLRSIPWLVECNILHYEEGRPKLSIPVVSRRESEALDSMAGRAQDELGKVLRAPLKEFLKGKKKSVPVHLKGVPLQKQYMYSDSAMLMIALRMAMEKGTPEAVVSYRIPVMKSQNYTADEIFEKNLLFLIPFHIFSYEKDFEACEKDSARLETLKKEYAGISGRLEGLLEQGEVNEYTKCTINDMSRKVLENIAWKYGNVKEGVKSVMGGRILDYEAKQIKAEGLQEGRKEGQIETLIELVKDNILSVQEAASRASLPEAGFREQMRKYGG